MSSRSPRVGARRRIGQSRAPAKSKTVAQEEIIDNDEDSNGESGASDHTTSEDETDFGKIDKWQPKEQKNSPLKKQNKMSKVIDDDDNDDELDYEKTKTRQKNKSPQHATIKYTSRKNGTFAKKGQGGGQTHFNIFFLTCIFIAMLYVVSFYGPIVLGKSDVREKDRQEKFESKLDELKLKFPNQNERFWNIVGAAPMSHLIGYGEVDRPVVILLASQPGAESATACIANQIADMYTVGLVGNLYDTVSINGSNYMTADSDYTKQEIDYKLRKGFDGFSKAAIVHRFDQLPACTALLFHSYCENDNAPYKDVAIILSVALDRSVGANNKEVERQINDHLGKSWSSCPDFQERGKIDAMLSRVANNIALVSSEETHVCNE